MHVRQYSTCLVDVMRGVHRFTKERASSGGRKVCTYVNAIRRDRCSMWSCLWYIYVREVVLSLVGARVTCTQETAGKTFGTPVIMAGEDGLEDSLVPDQTDHQFRVFFSKHNPLIYARLYKLWFSLAPM